MNLNTIVNNAKDYLGFYKEPVSDLSNVLSEEVKKSSEEIYKDHELLKSSLEQKGVSDIQIHQIMIMTKVDGFKELLERDERIEQTDIDRFIRNAIAQTGFNTGTVLEITAAIAYSLGIKFNYNSLKETKEEDEPVCGYTIPMSIYENDLRAVKIAVMTNSIDSLQDSDIEKLENLVIAGVPNAKYYFGYCLLEQATEPADKALALDYLKQAAEEGVCEASALLGDYYYNENRGYDWGKAYDYYTGYGSLALNDKRREALAAILNQKTFARKTLIFNIVLSLVVLASVIFAPGAAVFASHLIVGIIFFVLIAAENALAIFHNLAKPFDSNYVYVFATFAIWALFVAIRIIF